MPDETTIDPGAVLQAQATQAAAEAQAAATQAAAEAQAAATRTLALATQTASELQATVMREVAALQANAIEQLKDELVNLLSANGVNLAQATMGVGNIIDYWQSVGWAELNKVKNFNQAIEKIEQKIDVQLVQAKAEVVDKFRSML